MGMFDSMYDAGGNEWQTKAFDCELDRYKVGDEMPYIGTDTYQVEVFGGTDRPENSIDSLATVSSNILTAVPSKRDDALPLIDYHGEWIVKER